MSQPGSRSLRREQNTKIALTVLFFAVFAAFTAWMLTAGPGLAVFQIGPFDLTLLALATFRLGRLIAYDRVMEPFRQFFTQTVPDATGAGDSVEPKGHGVQQALGQLISCPICAGTWVAAQIGRAHV